VRAIVKTFFCIGPGCYGRGDAPALALSNMRSNLPFWVQNNPHRAWYPVVFIATDAPREAVEVKLAPSIVVEPPKNATTLSWTEHINIRSKT
jgi:hypothetical protein